MPEQSLARAALTDNPLKQARGVISNYPYTPDCELLNGDKKRQGVQAQG